MRECRERRAVWYSALSLVRNPKTNPKRPLEISDWLKCGIYSLTGLARAVRFLFRTGHLEYLIACVSRLAKSPSCPSLWSCGNELARSLGFPPEARADGHVTDLGVHWIPVMVLSISKAYEMLREPFVRCYSLSCHDNSLVIKVINLACPDKWQTNNNCKCTQWTQSNNSIINKAAIYLYARWLTTIR